MSSLIYLSGPQSKVSDPSLPISTDWKTYAASTFMKSGINVSNPIELDLSGFVSTTDDSGNAIKYSLNLIDKSDSLLANLSQVAESTTMEMFYAHNQGKRVVVVGSEPFSPWVMFHSEARFQRLRDALDYLVSNSHGVDNVMWASQFESQLVKRSEQFPPHGEADFEYYGGDIPVLVIAPHSTSYFRDGNLYSQESFTGSLSVLLHRLSGCHSLISSYCMAADPISYLNSPFSNFTSQLIKKSNVKLVLVLRGIEWSNHNDLILSNRNKNSLINKTEYLNLLTSMLKVKEFKDIGFDSPDVANHTFLEDLSVPVLDIHVNKRYRLPNLHPTQFSNLYTALAQYLMLVGIG